MSPEYTHIPEVTSLLPEITADSIVSRTFLSDDRLKAILFGFAPGQELSEHTASKPAVLHFLSGEARLTLGEETFDAGGGTWVHMQPHLTHSIYAITPVVMLLLMLEGDPSP